MAAIFRLLMLAATCLMGWNQACANCLIGVPHPTFYVGSDNQCRYSKIQDAIADVPSPTSCAPVIYVTNEHQPWNEALTITDRSLTLIGIAGGCGVSSTNSAGAAPDSVAATATSPQATISGAGHAGDSVITITGNSTVTLQNLDITGGDEDDFGSHGGGVYFNGTGSLTLDTDTIESNYAFYGAGIYMKGTDTNNVYSSLYLKDNVLIIHNTAQYSGGGVFMEGESNMYMTGQFSTISFNHALGVNPTNGASTEGYGGGVRIVGAATGLDAGVTISSPTGLVGAVSNNTAVYGGGIAVDGGHGSYGGSGFVSIYTTDADHPVEIDGNTASSAGGAIYLQNHYTAGGPLQNISYAAACLFDFRVEGNTAPQGAAFYLSSDDSLGLDDGTQFGLNTVVGDTLGAHFYDTPCTSRPGQVACTAGLQCNELSDNRAVDSSGSANGSIIFVGTGSTLIADKFILRGNSGGELIRFNGHGSVAGGAGTEADNNGLLTRCLVTDNTVADNLIYSDDGSNWSMQACTIANNSIPSGTRVIRADSGIALTNSILYQPGSINFDYSGSSSDLVTNYILTNDRTGYIHQSTVSEGDPLFYDPSATDIDERDYHLLAFEQNGSVTRSIAVDFAPSAGGTDLTGKPYDQDIPAVSNISGPRDLGAYEMQPITGRIFADAFGDPVSLVY